MVNFMGHFCWLVGPTYLLNFSCIFVIHFLLIIFYLLFLSFLNDITRFTDPTYIPNNVDILNARHRTTEITETNFEIDSLTYRVFDVGGQRTSVKKHLRCSF